MKHIAIIGRGIVGGAVGQCLCDYNFVYTVDPRHPDSINIEDIPEINPDFVFICLPTPSKASGHCDTSIIDSVLPDIERVVSDDCIVVLKSTVIPSWFDSLSTHKRFVYNPEFLTAARPVHDMANPDVQVIAGDIGDCRALQGLYESAGIDCDNVFYTNYKTASYFKYIVNTFLAIKVIYFNEIKESLPQDVEWEELINHLGCDPRMGKSHMQVPGPDGYPGFGGACFPKDTLALSKEVPSTLLHAAIRKNNILRAE